MANSLTEIQKRINSTTGVFRGSGKNLSGEPFSLQVANIIADTENKMLFVMRDSIQEMVEDMQTPRSRGGRMRVDTGFLRASGIANLGSIPIGLSKNPYNHKKKEIGEIYKWESASFTNILKNMKLGDIFFFGWTANYAKHREAYDGFMEASLQNWQGYVNSAIMKLKNQGRK